MPRVEYGQFFVSMDAIARMAIRALKNLTAERRNMYTENLRSHSLRRLVGCASAIPLLVLVSAPQTEKADYLLFNGKIFTASLARPYVQALAIKGERIIALGTADQMTAFVSPDTTRLDLHGHVVIPGFNDAHYHFNPAPTAYRLAFSDQDPSWDEVKTRIASAVTTLPKGTSIVGSTGVAVLAAAEANRPMLDTLAPDHPVRLATWTGHSSIFNSAFMRQLGINDREADPPGGYFTRDSDGKLTGRALEYANFRISMKLQQMTPEALAVEQAKQFFNQATRFGITSVQTMAMGSRDEIAALLRKAESPIRIRAITFPMIGPDQPIGPPQQRSSGNVTVSGLKWIIDGTPIERSGALRETYADQSSTSGGENFQNEEMEAMLREALRSGEQLLVHIVGDRAVSDFLDAMIATGGHRVWSQRRVRIEHGDGIMPDLVSTAKNMGVIVVQNPTHFTIGPLLTQRYGAARAVQNQPVRSLQRGGVRLAIGSDGPLNPFINVMFASKNPFRPLESLTRQEAITAYTLTAAYAEFAEHDKGSLEVGKLADLAVLSQDIFEVPETELPKTESVLTIVGGKIVYRRSDGSRLGCGFQTWWLCSKPAESKTAGVVGGRDAVLPRKTGP
jgi:predicted amidohydrolase YtcJ